jgi:hypothetical protein
MSRVFRIIVFPILSITVSCTYTFYSASCEYPVTGSVRKVTNISDTIKETSGIIWSDGSFHTFNDSGGDPSIYSFSDSCSYLRITRIENATNVDWEDVAYDGEHLYIADAGNNFGRRDTFVIYKFRAAELLYYSNIQNVFRITYSYNEELSRNPAGFSSHDCEAMVAYGDSLYLFAKDWVTLNTRVYALPQKVGHYEINSKVCYPVKALITGADINVADNEMILVGYRNAIPVIIRYKFGENPALIECGGKARRYPRWMGAQVEGVCYHGSGNIYITSEKSLYKQALYRVY